MLSDKTSGASEYWWKLEMIESDKSAFIAEQQAKINQLHNYLDEKLRSIIAEYEKATEIDVVNVKNNIDWYDEASMKQKLFINEV